MGIGIVIAAVIAAVALNPLFAGRSWLWVLCIPCMYLYRMKERKSRLPETVNSVSAARPELLRKLFGEYAQMKQIYYEFDAYQETD